MLYAVVVAFVVFVTWNGYDDATKNLQLEASQVLDIFHSARAFPDPASKIIQDGLISYTNSVHNDELRRMAGGDIGIYSTGSLRNLIAVFDGMNDKSIPNSELVNLPRAGRHRLELSVAPGISGYAFTFG